MDFPDFVRTSEEFWNDYLHKVQMYDNAGQLRKPPGQEVYYPTSLICTKTPTQFIVELLGASLQLNPLKAKKQRAVSADLYINQFDLSGIEHSIMILGDTTIGANLVNLTFAAPADLEEISRRFPFVSYDGATVLRTAIKSEVRAIKVERNHLSSSLLNCTVVNSQGPLIRVKRILVTIIMRSVLPRSHYKKLLTSIVNHRLPAIQLFESDLGRSRAVAGYLANLYLSADVRETTIGDYLHAHPDLLKNVLRTRRFEYEPYLKWIERPFGGKDEAINPDLFVERDDGFWDIYDLKTAALTKPSLTKGPQRRRRFIDYVNEGIAQLCHYESYFDSPANQAYARERYGIKVKDPNLVLVVGHYENVDPQEVTEACRAIKNISIIDYSTLMTLLSEESLRKGVAS